MVDLAEFDDGHPPASDFRRANGAPLVRSLDGRRWERYSRPSSWGKDLDDESALVLWKISRAIEGVAARPDLAARISANLGRKEGAGALREEAIQVGRGEADADLGTALHAMAHRIETEPGFKAPEPHAADLACLLNTVDSAGLKSTHWECHLCADRWRAAGTADRIYQAIRQICLPDGTFLEPGQSVIGDLKTGKKLDYSLPGYTIQEAIYADSVFYDVDTDERSPLPDGLRTDWGLIVHMPAGQATCTLWWADLEVGRTGARIVQQVREWRKRKDFSGPFVFPPSDEVAVLSSGVYELEHPVEQLRPTFGSWSADVAELSVADAEYNSEAGDGEPVDFEPEWVAGMCQWAQERINRIGDIGGHICALLVKNWPEHVAPLTQAVPSAADLASVLDVLDSVEAAFAMPYLPGDPRELWNRGRHHSEAVRGNRPWSHG